IPATPVLSGAISPSLRGGGPTTVTESGGGISLSSAGCPVPREGPLTFLPVSVGRVIVLFFSWSWQVVGIVFIPRGCRGAFFSRILSTLFAAQEYVLFFHTGRNHP